MALSLTDFILVSITITAAISETEVTLSPEEQALEDRYMNVMDCYCTDKPLPDNIIQAMELCKKKHLNQECRRKCEIEVFGNHTPLNKMRHLICDKTLESKKQFMRCYTREYRKGVQEGRWHRAKRGIVLPYITQEQFDKMSPQEKAKREQILAKIREELKRKFIRKLACMERVLGISQTQKCKYL